MKLHKVTSPTMSGSVWLSLLSLTISVLLTALPGPAAAATSASADGAHSVSAAKQAFTRNLPLYFEKNQGQFDSRASFMARMPGGSLFLAGADAVLVHASQAKEQETSLRMSWVGGSAATAPQGEAVMAAKTNYIVGNDSSRWHTGVSNFERVRQSGLYPGIDLVYYGNQQHLEYDLTVQPGADLSAIRLQVDGAASLKLDKASGDLLLIDALGSTLRLLKPAVYQLDDRQQKTAIAADYVLSARNTVSFALGNFDHTRPVVIDPEVIYSTVFGGSETPTDGPAPNVFGGIAVDPKGFVYLGGLVSGSNMPVTAGALQPACGPTGVGCSNYFVAKFDPTQSGTASLIYSTYIGGDSAVVYYYLYAGNNLAVDADGDTYFVGHIFTENNTADTAYGLGNYPTTANAYETTCTFPTTTGCSEGYLTKLNPTGTALLYSTWISLDFGAVNLFGMTYPSMVAVDGNQIAYVANGGSGTGTTYLAAINTTKSGAASLVYATAVTVDPASLAVDSAGNAYLGGYNFEPNANANAAAAGYQPLILNGFEASADYLVWPGVVARFNPSGQNVYATIVGTGPSDYVSGVAADPGGIVYVTGSATNIPQVNGLPTGATGTVFGDFVAKIDTNLTGAESLVYSTYIYQGDASFNGGYGNLGVAVSSNGSGLFAFSGETPNPQNCPNYPLTNPIVQPNMCPAGQKVSYVGVIDPSQAGQNALVFLSFLDGADLATGLAFNAPPAAAGPPNSSYNVYVAGGAQSNQTDSPFLGVPASYEIATNPASNAGAALFFYQIGLGAVDQLSVSPVSLPFPPQPINTTSPPLSFKVTNNSADTVDISSVSVPAPFAILNDGCSPSIPANSSCVEQVTYSPTVASTIQPGGYIPTTSSVSIAVPGVATPLTENVSGIGVAANTATGFFNPPSINFGAVADGNVAGPIQITLTNTSVYYQLYPQNEGLVAADFPAGFVFTPTGATPCGATLAIGASCTFSVGFAPTMATETQNGTNNYFYTAYASSTSSMTFAGTGLPPVVATPVFSPAAGTYGSAQSVTINDATAGATIYYTTNGSLPSTNSAVYASAINVTANETVQAMATKYGYTNSPVAVAAYVIETAAATPTFSPAPGTYTSSQSVTISDSTAGAAIYYTTNGTTPSATNGTKYTGAIPISANTNFEAVAVAAGYANSAAAMANYVITLPAATPTFTPAAGTYDSTKSVAISDSTAGATIYYTTNGSTPTVTPSELYAGAISVSANETIEAIATATGYTTSAVGSAAYVITPPAATPTFSVPVGTYDSTQSVALSDTSSGATIYYTTNGSTPTASSTKYTGPISVSSNETIKAIATGGGYSSSAVASAQYTIKLPQLSSSSGALTFSSTSVGTSAATQAVTIKNTGQSTLDVTGSGYGISITGTNASSFSQTNTCTSNLAPGKSCIITVGFKPKATGSLSAYVSVATNATTTPNLIDLAGTGK